MGMTRNETGGVRWLRPAATMRLLRAQPDPGALHFFGRDREIGFPEALSGPQAAAAGGHPLVQLNLGGAYLTGGPES